MEDSDAEIIADFLLEAREILDSLENEITKLVLAPFDQELVRSIFRGMHTLKGNSGVFALPRIEKLSRAAGALMASLFNKSLTFDTIKATTLLETVETIRDIVINVALHSAESIGDDHVLIDRLQTLAQQSTDPISNVSNFEKLSEISVSTRNLSPLAQENTPRLDLDDEAIAEFIHESRDILNTLDQGFVELELNPGDSELIDKIFRSMHVLKSNSRVFSFVRLERLGHATEALLSVLRQGKLEFDSTKATMLLRAVDIIREIITYAEEHRTEPAGDDTVLIQNLHSLISLTNGLKVSTPHQLLSSKPSNRGDLAQADSDESQIITKSSDFVTPIKVHPELLDKLINVASEMVLARNRLLPFTNQYLDHGFSAAVRSIDLLTRELQERMMTTRMEPISQVWMKLPRMVRDIAAALGKKVEVIQEGADTELDRTLLDSIRDPLVHIIRNCVDHGIEAPDQRLVMGKPAIGRVFLRATHENGTVVIEITDDGAGVDFEAVRGEVITRNLASADDAASFSDNQLLPYIFLPGFSTKKLITELSGRGVGTDVVKTSISNIGGTVEVESHRGRGTNMRLKIPLTLAIMPALFVLCQGERYAIPQNSVVEMIHINPKGNATDLEDFYGVPVFRLREKLVPLLFLSKQLELDVPLPPKEQALNVAVLQSNGVLFGLAVDEILNIQEVVIKSIGQGLKNIMEFSGATILGDGRVALILHIDGIATNSGLVAKLQARELNPPADLEDKATNREIAILLFGLSNLDGLAIELSYVERLEKVPTHQIQRNGDRAVVKYGNGIMPLIYLDRYIQGASESSKRVGEFLSVIVHYFNNHPVGLVVDQVKDILHIDARFHHLDPPQRGLRACLIRGDQIINLIDLQEILMLYNAPVQSNNYPQTIDVFSDV